MNFTKLRIGKTLFTVLTLPTLLLLCVGQAWGYEHTLTEAMGEIITMDDFTPRLAAGDTVIISPSRTTSIYLSAIVGSSSSWITFTNPNDSKITISDDGTSQYNMYLKNCRYIKVLGNNYGSETYGIRLTAGVGGLRVWDSSDYEIAYLEIDNTVASTGISHNGTDLTQSTTFENVSVHDNYIHDTATEGLYYGKSLDGDYPQFENIQIYDNIIDNCGWDCLQVGQTTGSNNNVYGNIMTDCGTSAVVGQKYGLVVSWEGNAIEVYQNYIARVNHSGIEILSAAGTTYIHDNVIWDAGENGSGHGIKINVEQPHEIINNTIVSSGGYGIKDDSGGTSGIIRYNLLVANGDGGVISSYSTQTYNRVQSSTSTEYFVNASTGDFHLTTLSPANDAGIGAGYSVTDYDGNTRPSSDNIPDIGAYENYGDMPLPVKNLKIKTTND